MNNSNLHDENEDDARPLYEVIIDGSFYRTRNPAPTGRELLKLTGKAPEDFWLTLPIPGQPSHLVDPDEPFDLTAPGAEVFQLVSKQRYYSGRIDEQPFETPHRFLSGRELLALVGRTPEECDLTFQIIGALDQPIAPDEKFDLGQPGREQFFTVARKLIITIDGVTYSPHKEEMLGSELRLLPAPPIGEDKELWYDFPGADDQLISPQASIQLHSGMVFYSRAVAKSTIELIVVISGAPTEVTANLHEPLKAVALKALAQTGNDEGRPIDQWDLKDKDGHPLDMDREVDEFHFTPGTRLYLSPKIGAGG